MPFVASVRSTELCPVGEMASGEAKASIELGSESVRTKSWLYQNQIEHIAELRGFEEFPLYPRCDGYEVSRSEPVRT